MPRRFLLLVWVGMGGVVLLFTLLWRVGWSLASADAIKINEFFPNPLGSAEAGLEFIELINTGSDAVDISGWKVDDVDGNADAPYTIPAGTTLSAGGIIHFLGTTTGITLNNTSDSVRLIDSGGVVQQSFSYTSTVEGKSFNRSGDDFVLNDPTPGQPNAGAPVNQSPVAVIAGPISGLTGQALTFSGSGSSDPEGGVLTYAWDFGDGSAAGSGVSINHTYAAVGSFTVTLTVTDVGGLSHVAMASVVISAPVFSSAIVVNEFLPDPTGTDTGNEFVELFNTGDTIVDLSGWKIDDVENGGSAPWVIPTGSIIAAHGFLVLHPSITLNNDADSVRLLAPDGLVKSHTAYTSSTEGQSHNRKDDGSFALSTTLTPGAANIFTGAVLEEEKETVYPDGIVVNEFLPNPEGTDSDLEFIEIKNTSSDSIDIGGWKMDDGEGGSSGFPIPAGKVLGAGALIHFLSSETKISLGNTSDTVRVLDPAGKVKSSFKYSKSHEGVSYARRDEGEMVETTTLTPGAANVLTPIEETSSSSSSGSSSSSSKSSSSGKVEAASVAFVALAKVKGLKDGVAVATEGVVSAPPGSLSNTILYLSGSGIQVYASKGFGVFELGDKVRVTGKMSTSGGERRILVSVKTDVVKVGVGEVPSPHELKTGEVGEAWEGSLISVAGKVVKTSGDTFYINDGSGEARVFIRDATNIAKPRLTKGTLVSVIGVVSETKAGYRVMPRWQDDVFFGVRPKASFATTVKKSSKSSKKPETVSPICPSPTAEKKSEVVCAPPATRSSLLLSNSLVFMACMAAMSLMIFGVRAKEPLLTGV